VREPLLGPIASEPFHIHRYLMDVMKIEGGESRALIHEVEHAQVACRDNYIATLFILNADKVRHGEMMLKIQNDYVLYGSPYPPTLTAAYDKLVNYKPSRPKFPRQMLSPCSYRKVAVETAMAVVVDVVEIMVVVQVDEGAVEVVEDNVVSVMI
jgi:hypothetical protein